MKNLILDMVEEEPTANPESIMVILCARCSLGHSEGVTGDLFKIEGKTVRVIRNVEGLTWNDNRDWHNFSLGKWKLNGLYLQ